MNYLDQIDLLVLISNRFMYMATTLVHQTNKAMFKVFFALLITVFSFKSAFAKGSGYEKAFTATCAMEGSIKDEVYCTYSLIFGTPLTTGYSGNATISINNVQKTYSIIIYSNEADYGINFKVQKGDEILITFVPDAPVSTTAYNYNVYNAPNDQGYSSSTQTRNGALIIGSRSRNFQVINPCASSCTYQIKSTSKFNMWLGSGVTIDVFVNGVKQFDQFIGVLNYRYSAKKGDIITYQVNSQSLPVKSGLNALTFDSETKVIFSEWYSNLYFTPMIVTNNCTATFPPSPFGGVLVPVPPEALNEFLKANSAPLSTLWYAITLNPEQQRRRRNVLY